MNFVLICCSNIIDSVRAWCAYFSILDSRFEPWRNFWRLLEAETWGRRCGWCHSEAPWIMFYIVMTFNLFLPTTHYIVVLAASLSGDGLRTKRWMHSAGYSRTLLYYPQKLAAGLLPSGVPIGPVVLKLATCSLTWMGNSVQNFGIDMSMCIYSYWNWAWPLQLSARRMWWRKLSVTISWNIYHCSEIRCTSWTKLPII